MLPRFILSLLWVKTSASGISQRLQQTRSLARAHASQPAVPLLEKGPQPAAIRLEFSEFALRLLKLPARQGAHVPARCAASVANLKQCCKLRERKPDRQRLPDYLHPLDGVRRILAIAAGGSSWPLKQADPLVITHGVRAHPSQAGQLARFEGSLHSAEVHDG